MSKTPRTRQLLMVAVIPATLVVLTIFAYSALAQGAGTGDQPRNLRIQNNEDGMILTWDAPAEDTESVTGYRIKRRAPDKGQRQLRVLVADTGSTETTYLYTTTKNGVRYVYRVHALRGEVVFRRIELRRKKVQKSRYHYAHAYSDSHTDINRNRNPYFHSQPYRYTYRDLYTYTYSYSHVHAHSYRNP